jgi:SNF2 family DNA or RNA helicase
LGPYIHRFTGTPEYRKHLPRVQEEVVEVQMTPRQEQTYKGIATRNPILAYKIRNNLPPSKRELKDMNAFMSAMRQISNNPTSFDGSMSDAPNEAVVAQSPKFKAMVDDIQSRSKKDPNYRAVIYSNFLSSGVKPVVEELKNRHVPAETFTGELNDKLRQQIVDNLNRGRVKVLGLSPAGGEGLDLKGVRQVHLTEDHWNPERTAQAVGRSARYKSHEHLPEDQRRVDVKRYVAVHPDRWYHRLPLVNKPLSADQWIMSRRQEKQELNQRFLRALPEYSG